MEEVPPLSEPITLRLSEKDIWYLPIIEIQSHSRFQSINNPSYHLAQTKLQAIHQDRWLKYFSKASEWLYLKHKLRHESTSDLNL